MLLAALDTGTFTDSGGATVSRVTLYQPHTDGTFSILTSLDLPGGLLYADIAADDLTGDGRGDLVITASSSDLVFVALQLPTGSFELPQSYAVGANPSAIDLVDVNGDSHPDIVVTDQFSGQVSVLLGNGDGTFAPEERFRAGPVCTTRLSSMAPRWFNPWQGPTASWPDRSTPGQAPTWWSSMAAPVISLSSRETATARRETTTAS